MKEVFKFSQKESDQVNSKYKLNDMDIVYGEDCE